MGRRYVVHNLIAHPLLVLCPPLGRRLHDRTAPKPEWLFVPLDGATTSNGGRITPGSGYYSNPWFAETAAKLTTTHGQAKTLARAKRRAPKGGER